MDAPQRTGYRSSVRFPAVPRVLVLSTLLASVLVGVGGFVLGQSMADDGTPGAAPTKITEPAEQPNPIVIPEPLEVPSA